jgi:hypothetical protein
MKALIMICALATSFMPGTENKNSVENVRSYQTLYYWFDTNLNYLRMNTMDDESLLTGYSSNLGNPKTLRELGFTPSHCTGTPPAPIDPDAPDVRYYSHP